MAQKKETWTKQLTNAESPFIVKEEYGFSKFNVVCETATPIRIKGSGRIGEFFSEDINLNDGESFGYDEGTPVGDWIITIPENATCKCIAIK